MSDATAPRLRIVQADITRLATTAIVNSTNPLLLYLPRMGGADSLIFRAAGPRVVAECRYLHKRFPAAWPMGRAIATSGGNLAATCIIHTAGPTWHDGSIGEASLLRQCYQDCLRIAAARQFESVAFPGISTGIYGYPKAEAAAIAVHEVRQWLATHAWPQEVVLVAADGEMRRQFELALAG